MKVRPYRMQARAEGVERTRTAILDAVDEVFIPEPGRPFSLEEIAQRAGTTVQTILRHFDSKAGLIEAASLRGLAEVRSGRDQVPTGDLDAIAAYLCDHYEAEGPMMLGFLAVEGQLPEVAAITARGRKMHRGWVARVLGPFLEGVAPEQRRRRLAVFVAVTDLLTWKVLRHEQRLTPREYAQSVRELLDALS